MDRKQDRCNGCALASKPSTAFSTASSVASATSAGTSRSGGSRLLFGEIDTNSDRSFESYASVCSIVLCDSSTFLKFWLEDKCRDRLLSFLPKHDLASLRLACHDFSVRAAPALFSDLSITFRTSTFTRPSKLAALDRLGFYVKRLRFRMPHSQDTFLPPLVDPETGAELSFTYTPQLQNPSSRRPKYGDAGTTDILTRQYPTLFHAATNVAAFVRAFSALVNLEHLDVFCPGYEAQQRYKRSIVDYALISLRIAVEKNSLNALDTLTLSPIHPGGVLSLSPLLGLGASPRSASRWSRIRNLTMNVVNVPSTGAEQEPDIYKLVQTYLCNFQTQMEVFHFRWLNHKGQLPMRQLGVAPSSISGQHPALADQVSARKSCRALRFAKLRNLQVENVNTSATCISEFLVAHKSSIKEIRFDGIELSHGTWDDALAPMTKRVRRLPRNDTAEIPIMLSPSASPSAFPARLERVEVEHRDTNGHKSLRISRWLPSRKTTNVVPRRLKDGLLGCEEQLRKVLRGSAFPWV